MAPSSPEVHVSGGGWRQKWFQTVNVSLCRVGALWLFWCKGPNKPCVGHDLTDLNQMCRALQSLLKDLLMSKCERQWMFFVAFFSTMVVHLSSCWQNIPRAPTWLLTSRALSSQSLSTQHHLSGRHRAGFKTNIQILTWANLSCAPSKCV